MLLVVNMCPKAIILLINHAVYRGDNFIGLLPKMNDRDRYSSIRATMTYYAAVQCATLRVLPVRLSVPHGLLGFHFKKRNQKTNKNGVAVIDNITFRLLSCGEEKSAEAADLMCQCQSSYIRIKKLVKNFKKINRNSITNAYLMAE